MKLKSYLGHYSSYSMKMQRDCQPAGKNEEAASAVGLGIPEWAQQAKRYGTCCNQ